MPNLNSMMFYKVKFSISANDEQEDLLWKVIMHIKNWQVNKWARRKVRLTQELKDWTTLKLGGKVSSSGNEVHIISEYFFNEETGAKHWACKIIENPTPPKGYANREWITELGYEQEINNVATISCVVSYGDRAGFIGPYEEIPAPSIPNIIKKITQDKTLRVYCGADLLTGTATELYAGDWPDFYGRIINPERQLPYIFISPQITDKEKGEIVHLIQPHRLAEGLYGNALVFYTSEPEFSYEISYMNEEYTCYGGAIRVYQANVTDPSKHRYLSASDISLFGEEQTISFLIRAFAQNVHFYDTFFCIEECQRKKSEYIRRKRLEVLHATHQKQIDEAKNDSFSEALEEAEKRMAAETELEIVKEELTETRQENYNLTAQVEQLRGAAEENKDLRRSLDTRTELSTYPKTVKDVVDYFLCAFSDRLAFSEDAWDSLKECILPVDDLWKILFALANTMKDLYMKAGNGDIFTKFYEQTGIEAKRGEGASTRDDKKLMQQFKTEINGETIDIEAHITYPKLKQSIHFGYSSSSKKIVVGHCGKHLDIYSTRKVK